MSTDSRRLPCNRCGKEFGCGAGTGHCWCAAVPRAISIPKQYKDCLCPECLSLFSKNTALPAVDGLIEGDDFYYEHGGFVFTEAYHRKRGHCCKNNCRHCPWPELP